ncbi:MAG: ParB/RepB/Spo0J family partition protein [Termitinemataceae bacterium]|nr:MAG: ParB/RepB/Spo0J family partition protein [Termitinemataceae bacterium]
MAKKFGLGLGAEALFSGRNADDENTAPKDGASDINIGIEQIEANPNQPRKTFDESNLQELADSIKENGVIQPIIVEKINGNKYRIVAGERRFRASKLAGLTTIPAIVRNYTPSDRYAISLIENIQRADLNPIEEAQAYKNLMESSGISQDEAAVRVGKNRSTLANAMRLLKLPQNMQNALRVGAITAGHARAILSVEDSGGQKRVFEKVMALKLSVREAESFAGEVSKDGEKNNSSKPTMRVTEIKRRDSELDAMEQRFLEKLGTKVKIEGTLKKGIIKIDYFSEDDLDRINSILS